METRGVFSGVFLGDNDWDRDGKRVDLGGFPDAQILVVQLLFSA